MLRVPLLMCVLLIHFAAVAEVPSGTNLAATSAGAKAWSNGDGMDREHGGPFTADRAIDGVRFWYDPSGKPTGSGWMHAREGLINSKQPAIWGVRLPHATKVNQLRLFFPQVGLQATDFKIEFKRVGAEDYSPVRPFDSQWTNPVARNERVELEMNFETVTTDGFRITITDGAPALCSQPGRSGGSAYLSEFEAYYTSDEAREAGRASRGKLISELTAAASTWEKQRPAPPRPPATAQSHHELPRDLAPSLQWLRNEKLRQGFAPIATDKIIQYADTFKASGLNTLQLVSWHWDTRAAKLEEDIVRINRMAVEKDFHLYAWTAWYWYPDSTEEDGGQFKDRNAFAYLGQKYRGAVDFQGTQLFPTPCPFDETFWKSVKDQALQTAKWSTEQRFNRLHGLQYDFEFYGAPNGRDHDSWNYDKCFCDDCFAKFLETLHVKVTTDIPAAERFAVLKEAGALNAYYKVLTDRARRQIRDLRRSVDKINPDFQLGFYGIFPALGVFETSLDDLPKRRFWASWFGEAFYEELGTARAPFVHVPLITDPASNPYSAKRRELRQYFLDHGTPVVHSPGYLILPEQTPEFMRQAMAESLGEDDGWWINELWMFWSYKENPSKATPGWFPRGTTMQPIEKYRLAIEGAVADWQEKR
jgi:hypothetical protein